MSPLRHQCHKTDEDQRGNHPDRGGQTGVDGHIHGGRREHSSGPPQVRSEGKRHRLRVRQVGDFPGGVWRRRRWEDSRRVL